MDGLERRAAAGGVVIVGGGLAGLVAACYLARGGSAVTLCERAATLGGRAATDEHEGFRFNRGIHALYTGGAATDVLGDLGVAYGHGSPRELFARRDGRLVALPTTTGSFLRSALLNAGDKVAFARVLAALSRCDPRALARTSVADWIAGATDRPAVRRLLAANARPFVYSAALDLVSADLYVAKLRAAFRHPIHYIDGGWQALVDGLRDVAVRAGVRIMRDTRVAALDRREGRVGGVLLADGSILPAAATVVATGLRDALRLVSAEIAPDLHRAVAGSSPAQVRCLDVALRRLPDTRHIVVQDLDAPLFLSAQSRHARIAPDGAALIHAFKQLDPRRETDPHADERELEGLLDTAQPGWRALVVRRAYLPRLAAVGWLPTAATGGLAGRPDGQAAGLAGLHLVGDWIGPEGFLADASCASAREAARRITRELAVAGGAHVSSVGTR